MKKFFIGLVVSSALMCGFANESNSSISLSLQEGWNLKGLGNNLDTMEIFNNSCIEMVYSYDTHNKMWKYYSKNSNSNSLNNLSENTGFWVKTNTDCILTTSTIVDTRWIEETEMSQNSCENDYEGTWDSTSFECKMSYNNAVNYCRRRDGRLPTYEEFDDIYFADNGNNKEIPKDFKYDDYWTSTVRDNSDGGGNIAVFAFSRGNIYYDASGGKWPGKHHTRCIKD